MMLRLAIFILLVFATIICKAEIIIEGKILDETNTPIPYTNIGFANTSIGTVSDAAGNFSLFISENIDKEAVLRISVIGFETKEIVWKNINPKTFLKIEMKKRQYELAEIVIKPHQVKTISKGNKSEKSVLKNNLAISNRPNMNLGAAIGKKFMLGNKDCYMKEFNFYIAGNNYDTITFLVNFYEIDKLKPSEIINKKQIVKQIINHKKGWIKIDLSDENLILSKSIIASIEWIGASKRGNALFLNMNFPALGATHYYRFGSQNKWKVYPNMSSSMYLVYEKEKEK
jgi:hypothetical protein